MGGSRVCGNHRKCIQLRACEIWCNSVRKTPISRPTFSFNCSVLLLLSRLSASRAPAEGPSGFQNRHYPRLLGRVDENLPEEHDAGVEDSDVEQEEEQAEALPGTIVMCDASDSDPGPASDHAYSSCDEL